jgi:putative DNA primase/helicase
MVEGCLLWQAEGLNPPKVVLDTTEDYLHDEDTAGRWLEERTVAAPEGTMLSVVAYADWREWCGENGEYAGSLRRFVSALQSHKLEKWQDPVSRRNGFRGRVLKAQDSIDNLI